MRETRGSGLKWAGKIPTDWKITKGKYFMSALERPVRDDDGVITCFRDGVVTLRSNRREDGFTIATVEAGYQGIEPGDLVVHGMDGFAGAIGISDSRGKGTPALNILDCTENKRYIMYLLRSMAFSEVFMALSTGIRVRTCDTNWRKLRELDYLIPPINQQRLIFEYLDRKCTEIDLLTADIQTQIETLEQYKRSVITEAVTKGLNPDAEMKDSGVPWIGMLPAHWEVKKTKFLFEIVKRIAGREGFDVLSVTQKGLKVKDLTDYSGQIAENYSGYQFVYPTDYVMNHMDLLTGWVDCSKQFGVTSPDYRVFRLLSKDEHISTTLVAKPIVKLPTAERFGLTEDKEQRLSEIIDEINARTGKAYDNDVVIKAMLQIRDILMKSEKLRTSAKNNTQQDFEFSYFDDIDDALIEGLAQNQDFFSLLLSNDELKRQVLGIFSEEIYKSLREI